MFVFPSLGLAEIAWRWTFGFAAALVVAFTALEYFDTLPVGAGDIFLLRTRHPFLVSQAIAHIFRGSGFRAANAVVLVMILLAFAWVLIASWARAMTVRALFGYFREENPGLPPPSRRQRNLPLGLNFLRVMVTAAAVLGVVGAFVLAAAASPANDSSPGSSILVFVSIAMVLCAAWMILNWILSLSAIIAVAEGLYTYAAISSAIDLCRDRWGSVFAAGTWFGLAHMVVFFVASSAVMFPLAFAGVMPAGIVLGGMLLITLLYFAAADFLYAGRMAAYVAMILPPKQGMPESQPTVLGPDGPSSVDRSEVILSDVQILPALIPKPAH